jgi:hypothetical protein
MNLDGMDKAYLGWLEGMIDLWALNDGGTQ